VSAELEAIAARQAATRISPKQLSELKILIAEMHRFAEIGDTHAHAENNTAFHACVVRAACNKTLERMWSMLEPYARTYVTAMVPGTDLTWLGDRHVAILEALEAGDPARAAETMRHHAREAEDLVLAMDDSMFEDSIADDD
jgi:DNA-binding GntR family transcriptional regulator